MKIHGKKIDRPNQEVIAIPRMDGDDIIFIAKAVLDFSEFETLCPVPTPNMKMMRGGEKKPDFDDPAYKKSVQHYNTQRYNWIVLTSLRETPGLEWETIAYSDPNTWGNIEKELHDSGFSEIEILRIFRGVSDANSLSEDKVSEARQRFLAGIERDQLEKSSSLQQEQLSTQSGEAVKPGA